MESVTVKSRLIIFIFTGTCIGEGDIKRIITIVGEGHGIRHHANLVMFALFRVYWLWRYSQYIKFNEKLPIKPQYSSSFIL